MMLIKACCLLAVVLCASCVSFGDALPKFPEKRLVEFSNPVNPIVPEGLFFDDPAARVGPDGTLWIIGCRDEDPTYYASSFIDVLETKDLRVWRLHRGVFASKGAGDRIAESDAMMWDSNALFYNGQWHLFV